MQVSELSRVDAAFTGLRRANDSQYLLFWDGRRVGMVQLNIEYSCWSYQLSDGGDEFRGTFEQCVETAKRDYDAFNSREHVEVLEVGTEAVPAYVARGGAWRSVGAGKEVLVKVRGIVFENSGRRLPAEECYQQGVWVDADYAQSFEIGQRLRLVQKNVSFFLRGV